MNSKSVNLTIEGYPFISVPLSDADFNDKAAIYVIICVAQNGSWKTLDVGQSGKLGSRIDSHDRKDSWLKRCQNIWVCVYQMPSNKYTKEERLRVEKILRQKLSPACGVR